MAITYENGSIGVQLTPHYFHRVGVKEAKRNLIFSQMGAKLVQP